MTAEGNELYRATLDALEKRAPTAGPRWLTDRRKDARRRFSEDGLPTAKDEAWRFTSLRPVLKTPFVPAEASSCAVERALSGVTDFGGTRIVLVNGNVHTTPVEPPAGVRLQRISELLDRDPGYIEPHLCRHAVDAGFVAQNAAAFDDGLVIVVERRAAPRGLLHLVHASASGETPTVAYPRVLVIVEGGGELDLVETHVSSGNGALLENGVTEIVLGENSRLHHVRIHHGRATAYSVAATAVHQERDSRYVSRVFTFGGALSRLDLAVRLEGPGAECELDGLYHSTMDDQVEHHTFIDHVSPHATSREKYKGILDGSGKAVFDGIIAVRQGADRTQAHQENRNLLLSEDATIHTKPHLEIDAHDVQCSHGSTVGRLDENQLFYLRSRGIPLETARATLTYSFGREMVDRLPEGVVARHLADVLAHRLPNGGLAGELV